MRVECPSCHASGDMPDAEIPVTGRLVICPKCGHGFQVKPPAKAWSRHMMNTCPKCGHSTFSEETFAVCPKCGLDGEKYHEERQRQDALERSRRTAELNLPPVPPPSGSKYAANQVAEEPALRFKAPPLVQAIGWAFAAIGLISTFWGLSGLSDYFGTDWRAIFFEETGEHISASQVFFQHGFFPWVMVFFGLPTMFAAAMFLQLKHRALSWLEWSAWSLLVILAGREVWGAIAWVRRSSNNASFFYYLTGIAGGLLMIAIWTALIMAVIWGLRHERVTDPFDEFGS